MIRTISFFFFLIASLSAHSQYILSDQAEIGILTCSPGKDLYSTFGHTAIRVQDPVLEIDVVFNYGTFNFNTSNFYLKFIQGKLPYYLSIEDFSSFTYSYEYSNRAVYEQVLQLSPEEKQVLFDKLLWNYKPENRSYAYDFFFDNCSSRVRDIVEEALQENIQFQYKDLYIENTFMDLIDPYLGQSWNQFGIWLILGLPAHRIASQHEYMFLPDWVMYYFDSATTHVGGTELPLVKEKRTIVAPVSDTATIPTLFRPVTLFWILFIVVFITSVVNRMRKKHWWIIDRFLLIVTGLLGVFFLFMWFGTDHQTTASNLNMLWAFPFNLVMAFFIHKSWGRTYATLVSMTLVLTLLSWIWLPQSLHISILPLVGILLTRYGKIATRKKGYSGVAK